MISVAKQINPAIEAVVRTHNEEEAALLGRSRPAPSSSASRSWRAA